MGPPWLGPPGAPGGPLISGTGIDSVETRLLFSRQWGPTGLRGSKVCVGLLLLLLLLLLLAAACLALEPRGPNISFCVTLAICCWQQGGPQCPLGAPWLSNQSKDSPLGAS